MSNFALLMAVEDYADKAISPVRYAAADLTAFSQALQQLDVPIGNQTLLLNEQATKASIESGVRTTLRRLAADDTLIIYYAGHGFASGGHNCIACHDTRRCDLANTSISLHLLYQELKFSKCRRISFFLDAFHSGIPADPSLRAIHSDFNDDELAAFFQSASHCVCFAACRSGETSHSSTHLKLGIWTHHVLEALQGNAPLAIVNNRFVTAMSLQNYVTQAVPRALRAEFTTPKVQTPWSCGGLSDDFIVADLSSILDSRQNATADSEPRLDTVIISSTDRGRVKALSGFQKSHRVPDRKNSTAEGFISQISEQELQVDLSETFQSLRKEYKFKRLELEQRGPAEGRGVIITPYFEYSLSVELAADEPSEVIWRRELRKLSNPAKIFCNEFEKVFTGVFDTIEISTGNPIDVASVIDRIEELDRTDVSVSYDSDCTECTVRLTGVKAAIRVTKSGLFIEDTQADSLKSLLQSAMAAQHRLTHEFGIKALPAS